MSKTVLAKVDGFTPLIDNIVKEYGIFTAAVFGRVWRYCQMESGVCQASVEKMAAELDMSTRTIIRHLDILVCGGYLIDKTPDLRNRPHTYIDTGKASLRISIDAMTESHSAMTQSHSRYDLESQQGVTESHMKIDSLREDLRELEESSDKKSQQYDEFGFPIPEGTEELSGLSSAFEKLANIMAYDLDRWQGSCQNMTRNNVTPETLGRAYAALKEKGYTVSGPWSIEKTAISMAAEDNKPREMLQFDESGRIL